MVQLSDIALARYRLSRYLQPTPLEEAPGLGPSIYLKLENANRTHSFKVRGALNAMLALSDAERAVGIVAASSGNHAQGIAYAAKLLDVEARIYMSKHTAQRKIANVKRLGAQAVIFGDTPDEAELEGRRVERDERQTYISPYNDANVIAGAGTIGLELLDELPNIERVIVATSGGGLISGVALALKSLRPKIEVIGVCAASAPGMFNAMYNTHLPEDYNTLADALSGGIEHGSITLDIVRQLVDSVVLVSEEAIRDAMRWMMTEHGWIAEGGGVVGVAALQSGVVQSNDKPTAVIVSGGNVDTSKLCKVLGC
ncbi:MAG: threonine/serine dehydratase [Burkholderiales bacterium]|nr:threonine/serine dehydratase [Anaerolineae bacterium]